jgi:membrane protein DedA with SNARE-associated domain
MALLPKFRFFSPIIAGISDIGWKKFFWVNFFATLLYVSVYIGIGLVFQNQLNRIFKKVQFLQHSIFILVMIAIIIYATFAVKKIYMKREAKSKGQA